MVADVSAPLASAAKEHARKKPASTVAAIGFALTAWRTKRHARIADIVMRLEAAAPRRKSIAKYKHGCVDLGQTREAWNDLLRVANELDVPQLVATLDIGTSDVLLEQLRGLAELPDHPLTTETFAALFITTTYRGPVFDGGPAVDWDNVCAPEPASKTTEKALRELLHRRILSLRDSRALAILEPFAERALVRALIKGLPKPSTLTADEEAACTALESTLAPIPAVTAETCSLGSSIQRTKIFELALGMYRHAKTLSSSDDEREVPLELLGAPQLRHIERIVGIHARCLAELSMIKPPLSVTSIEVRDLDNKPSVITKAVAAAAALPSLRELRIALIDLEPKDLAPLWKGPHAKRLISLTVQTDFAHLAGWIAAASPTAITNLTLFEGLMRSIVLERAQPGQPWRLGLLALDWDEPASLATGIAKTKETDLASIWANSDATRSRAKLTKLLKPRKIEWAS